MERAAREVDLSASFGCGNGHPLAPGEDRGQNPLINVAMAHGLADLAPRYKSQRTRGEGPARDQ